MPDKKLVEYFIEKTDERFLLVNKKLDWLTGIVMILVVILLIDSKSAGKIFEIAAAMAGAK